MCANAVIFLTLSFIYANIQSLSKISLSYDVINFISTPIFILIMLFSFWYVPARLNSELSYIKVNDEGVEFSRVNLRLQTITKFFKWDEIKIFEMYERRDRNSLKGIMPQLYLGVDKEMQYKLPNQPFQTLTD